MKKLTELSKISKATDLAQDVHTGQYRKVTKKPYIVHPFRVYQRAKSLGLSDDIQIVAILHDTYEDASNREYVAQQIKSKFGDTILKYVLLLSHDKDTNYNDYVLALAKKSNIALSVKLLDMIENLLDSPSPKQKTKYFGALQYLLKNGVKIDKRIIDQITKASK